MFVEEQITINGTRAAIWAEIANIENASEIMSGIEKIEVLEKPASGLVGLRWCSYHSVGLDLTVDANYDAHS